MKQKIAFCVLLLLVCGSVAAEPINKPDNTAAAHPSISPKSVETTQLDRQIDCLALPLRRRGWNDACRGPFDRARSQGNLLFDEIGSDIFRIENSLIRRFDIR